MDIIDHTSLDNLIGSIELKRSQSGITVSVPRVSESHCFPVGKDNTSHVFTRWTVTFVAGFTRSFPRGIIIHRWRNQPPQPSDTVCIFKDACVASSVLDVRGILELNGYSPSEGEWTRELVEKLLETIG